MPQSLKIEEFIFKGNSLPIMDVRSPKEFEHAHIPGAISFPMMNNEERIAIGTIFKQQGREEAVMKGFELIGPKFADFVKQANLLFPGKEILVYCWRGGLRSNIMSFVLETAGFKICLLKGGYKAFRRKALVVLEEPLPLLVLGGMTGSGKTVVLKSLAEKGEKIIDLEALANHKGSAFGALGELPQPSNEHFENLLAKTIMDAGSVGRIWVENESRMIGRIKIPDLFFSFMRKAPVIELSIPQNERINEIKRVYANFKKSDLIACTEKLRKKLGGLRMNDAINSLEEGNLEAWIKILLVYYDENYQYAGEGRLPNSITKIEFEKINPERIAAIILEQLTMKL